MPIRNSLRRRLKRSISSFRAEPRHVLSIAEGEEVVVTYTAAVDKMKVFAAFIREGLENGDLVDYSYPDEESKTVRAELRKHGIDVEKHERKGDLILETLTEYYMADGKFDKERLIKKGLNDRAEAKRRGYKHYRSLDDLGDFSFLNGQWQKYIEYWDDPEWESPSSPDAEILDYSPFVTELTAFSVEGIGEADLAEMLKAFWVTHPSYTVFIDLLGYTDAFSKLLGIPHKKLVGRKFLLEFDPASDYEKVIESLTKEAMANVCPIFVFTSRTSSLHAHLAKHSSVGFFLSSTSVSWPESTSKNEVLLPANNPPLILDSLGKVLEEYSNANVFLVFDKISELINLVSFDRTYEFLLYASEMLLRARATAMFLLNTSAHEPPVVSRVRGLFNNLLAYDKNGLKIVKVS